MSEWSITPPGEVHEVDSRSGDYGKFRSGTNFAEVAQELRVEARHVFEAEGRRMFLTRSTVLGRLHEHKQRAWLNQGAWKLESDHMPDVEAVSFDPGEDFF